MSPEPRRSDFDPEQHFERYLEGTWRRRWWTLVPNAPTLLRVERYKTGRITGDIIGVSGRADDGTRVEVELRPNRTRIPGYRKVVERA